MRQHRSAAVRSTGRGRRFLADRVVHQHQAGDLLIAMRPNIGERVEHPERPAHQQNRHRLQIGDQFGDVLAAPAGLVAIRRRVRVALTAWVECHDVMALRECADLWLPDPRRHGPARNKDDGVTEVRAGLQIVQPHPVAGDEVPALRRSLGRRRPGQQHDQRRDDAGCDSHATSTPTCTASCQCPRRRRRLKLSDVGEFAQCGRPAQHDEAVLQIDPAILAPRPQLLVDALARRGDEIAEVAL